MHPPEAMLQDAGLVVVAEVLAVERVVEGGGCGGPGVPYTVATMEVLEAFRGAEVGETLEVRSGPASCRVPIDQGEQWLLFTSRSRPSVDYCSVGSTPLGSRWSFAYCEANPRDQEREDICGEGADTVPLTEEEVLERLRVSASK